MFSSKAREYWQYYRALYIILLELLNWEDPPYSQQDSSSGSYLAVNGSTDFLFSLEGIEFEGVLASRFAQAPLIR